MGTQNAMAKSTPTRFIGEMLPMAEGSAPANKIAITTTTSLPSRPRQEAKERMPMTEAAMKRVETAVAEGFLAPVYGSALGKMRLRHELSEALYGVCLWYQDKRADYELAMEIKGTKTGAMEQRSKSEPPDVDSDRGKKQAKRDRAARQDFEAAQLAALACGRGQLNAFENVVLNDMAPDYLQRMCVKNVAEALMKHRQLASRQRQGRRR